MAGLTSEVHEVGLGAVLRLRKLAAEVADLALEVIVGLIQLVDLLKILLLLLPLLVLAPRHLVLVVLDPLLEVCNAHLLVLALEALHGLPLLSLVGAVMGVRAPRLLLLLDLELQVLDPVL